MCASASVTQNSCLELRESDTGPCLLPCLRPSLHRPATFMRVLGSELGSSHLQVLRPLSHLPSEGRTELLQFKVVWPQGRLLPSSTAFSGTWKVTWLGKRKMLGPQCDPRGGITGSPLSFSASGALPSELLEPATQGLPETRCRRSLPQPAEVRRPGRASPQRGRGLRLAWPRSPRHRLPFRAQRS